MREWEVRVKGEGKGEVRRKEERREGQGREEGCQVGCQELITVSEGAREKKEPQK